jgi:hypothetical protein
MKFTTFAVFSFLSMNLLAEDILVQATRIIPQDEYVLEHIGASLQDIKIIVVGTEKERLILLKLKQMVSNILKSAKVKNELKKTYNFNGSSGYVKSKIVIEALWKKNSTFVDVDIVVQKNNEVSKRPKHFKYDVNGNNHQIIEAEIKTYLAQELNVSFGEHISLLEETPPTKYTPVEVQESEEIPKIRPSEELILEPAGPIIQNIAIRLIGLEKVNAELNDTHRILSNILKSAKLKQTYKSPIEQSKKINRIVEIIILAKKDKNKPEITYIDIISQDEYGMGVSKRFIYHQNNLSLFQSLLSEYINKILYLVDE